FKNDTLIFRNIMLAREHSAGVLYNNKLYIFGGRVSVSLNDLFIYDLINKSAKRYLTPIPARNNHRTILFNNTMYIFGGAYITGGKYQYLNDFWKIDLDNMTYYEIKPINNNPEPRSNFCMHCKNNKIYLFGGGNATRYFND